MNRKSILVLLLAAISATSWLSYTTTEFLEKKGSENNEKNETIYVIAVSGVFVCRLHCCKDVK